MRICITGALGHIGSQLIRKLTFPKLEKIYLVDNLLTQRYASLFDLPKNRNFYFYEMDILAKGMEKIIKDSHVVVHLAAITNAEASFYNKELIDKVNKQGLENIARLCAKYKSALLFPSSTSVYGSTEELVDENCIVEDLKPQSPYADSKLYGEKFLKFLAEIEGLKYVVFRLGTIFGYSIGMRFHTAVNKFIWQAVNGEEITIWKTALNQKRPYCGLSDAITAIQFAITNHIFDLGTYNIVTLNTTVKEILYIIKEFIPQIKIKFVESPIMNQLSYQVSNKKSLAHGFTYKDRLKDSIEQTIKKLQYINASVIKKEDFKENERVDKLWK